MRRRRPAGASSSCVVVPGREPAGFYEVIIGLGRHEGFGGFKEGKI